ncbi:MAG: hypothetical protein J6M21_08375 [Campylobacter sp.]|nr:hypothetical protein [Campylobacter sp.]
MKYEVNLNDEALAELSKEIVGNGGFQRLFRKLQKQLNGSILSYDDGDKEQFDRCCKKYGKGGFQNTRLKKIIDCIERQK